MDVKVWVSAPDQSILAAALSAALTTYGFHCRALAEADHYSYRVVGDALLVVEEESGPAAQGIRPHMDRFAKVVCVGSVRSAETLVSYACAGALVLDQDVPFVRLAEHVREAVTDVHDTQHALSIMRGLRARHEEAFRLAQLTVSEERVLRDLAAGCTPAEIATRSHRSIHTVRSQIKAVLARLGVNSQVSAVAIAHRSWLWPESGVGAVDFTNIGDD